MATKEKMKARLNSALSEYNNEEVEKIIQAAEFADKSHTGQKRASGEDFIIHPIAVAINLANMHVDYEMIIAGLLHDVVEDTDVSLEEIKTMYGENIAILVDGVTKISKLKPNVKNNDDIKSETIRKMLFAMIKDIKIIIIKLADKLHNMDTLNFLPLEKRKRIANETLEIYAPLAGKIGMHFIKDRLEDLALRWLYPDIYDTIQIFFKRTEKDRERTLKLISGKLSNKLDELKIPFKIKSRTKHYFSIFKKMKKFNKRIDEIFDLNGVRVITDSDNNCYRIFGIIHNLWQPIPGRFRDFIANPKKNGYRSLHTTIIFEKRKAVEIQIRTEEMHEFNEYGIASHWYYKKGKTPDIKQLKWLSRLKEVHQEQLSPDEYYQTIRDDILKDEIYAFTPKGDAIELPKGATPIDFAYRIHTEIGHRCIGAIVNGTISPLQRPLRNGMVVEINTSKISKPKRSWLKFVKTSHARKKIKSWLAARKREIEPVQEEKADKTKKDKKIEKNLTIEKKLITKSADEVNNLNLNIKVCINGEKNFLYSFAKCCKPKYPDDIVGFISRGRGIIIHKKDCYNLQFIKEFDKRVIDVEWHVGK